MVDVASLDEGGEKSALVGKSVLHGRKVGVVTEGYKIDNAEITDVIRVVFQDMSSLVLVKLDDPRYMAWELCE
jgi:hypothetical protein